MTSDDTNQNIVGGVEAISGRYPYTVALTSNGFQFCGGSLIAPDTVITAAHCMDGTSFNVVIGRHDLRTSSGEEIARKTEIVHPNYDGNSMVNDFAIVLLSRAITQNVQFIKLNNNITNPSAGAISRTMGWGDTTEGGTGSNVLREVDLPIITNDSCNQKYSGEIFDSMICTFQPGKDSCQGDSGTDTLIGIVSWGIGCATNQYPGVYSRVSNGYDWIKTNVCSLSAFPPNDLCGSSNFTNRPTNKPTTKPPTNKPTTKPPTNKPTTKPPTNKPTTKPPTNNPTTKTPTNKPTTKPPTNKPTTKPPTNKPTTKSTNNIPTTKPPTNWPTTKVPTFRPTTKSTTSMPTTNKPTTKPPTKVPTTTKPASLTYLPTDLPTYFPTFFWG
ncbi:hypothetical protein HJC23_005979 [Cyclotella cryptica]|uniref:Peptidase S1 domain-containing protein n=1 Tax=Cyclotella cryptica TaxID=29204 RepID=A0ABD3NSL3_9STRA